MKIETVIFWTLLLLAAIIGLVGFVTYNQCTPLNRALGNCADPTPYFVVAGIAFAIALCFGLALMLKNSVPDEMRK